MRCASLFEEPLNVRLRYSSFIGQQLDEVSSLAKGEHRR